MFYSHEILTSPEHGVATIWLVATLGSRSVMRRVNRKAILDVDVPEACRVIVDPQAPMALRLQGNLLYGVSRVYHQQCGYTLLDAQSMHDKMISMLKILPGGGLDSTAGKTKPSSLLVPYDPSFLPETNLPGIDIDFSLFNIIDDKLTQRDNIWTKSPPGSNSTASRISVHLELGSDDIHRDGEILNIENEGTLSARKRSLFGTSLGNEEGILLQPDFEFDENGVIVEFDESHLSPRKRRKFAPHPDEGFGIDQNGDTMDDTEDMVLVQDPQLPNLDPGKEDANMPDAPILDLDQPVEEGIESGFVMQRQIRRRKRIIRHIIPDNTTTLRNTDLAQWNNEYIVNMANASKQKQQNKIQTTSKKNAAFCVFSQGIGSVGIGLGRNQEDHPLKRFSGLSLYNAVCESQLTDTKVRNSKETDSDSDTDTDSDSETEKARRLDSLDIEIGRHAPSSLIDEHSSQMPWNLSAQSSRLRLGSLGSLSAKLGDSSLRRRLTTASPLAGRGYLDPHDLSMDDADALEDLEITRYLEAELAVDHEDIRALSRRVSAIQRVAGQLDQESLNFFEFIQKRMEDENEAEMAFSALLPTTSTSRVIATQGLMNVLTLATKGVLNVRQKGYRDEGIDKWGSRYHYGEIFMRM